MVTTAPISAFHSSANGPVAPRQFTCPAKTLAPPAAFSSAPHHVACPRSFGIGSSPPGPRSLRTRVAVPPAGSRTVPGRCAGGGGGGGGAVEVCAAGAALVVTGGGGAGVGGRAAGAAAPAAGSAVPATTATGGEVTTDEPSWTASTVAAPSAKPAIKRFRPAFDAAAFRRRPLCRKSAARQSVPG